MLIAFSLLSTQHIGGNNTMKTKVILGTIAATAFGGVLFGTTAAHADTDVSTPTNSSITLYKDQIPGEGPFAGRLALTSTPAEFKYENKKIPTTAASSSAVANIADPSVKNYISLSDDRADKAAAWKLTALASKLESGSNELGATYKIGFATPQAYEGFAADPTLVTAAAPDASNLSAWSAATTKVDLTQSGAFSVAIPADGVTSTDIIGGTQKEGETAARYGVGLTVASNQLAITNLSNTNVEGTYTGTITWTLSDSI